MGVHNEQDRELLRDLLGINSVLGKLDGIHRQLRILMTAASDLTDTVNAVLGEESEILAALDDLASRVAGNPELEAAVADAQTKLRQAVTDLHAKVQAVDPTPPTA